LAGGPPRQLTHFQTDQIVYFAWSLDGSQVAFARGTQSSNVVLIFELLLANGNDYRKPRSGAMLLALLMLLFGTLMFLFGYVDLSEWRSSEPR